MDNRYNVLAVDDEQFNLDLIEASFSEYKNIKISHAKSGQEALNLLSKNNYNIILLDISMPIMNGIEVLKTIRNNDKYDNLPILMVTANTQMEKEALLLGANDFISKPYQIGILCARTINYAKMNYNHTLLDNKKELLENEVKIRTKELEDTLQLAKRTEYEISIRLGRASEFRDLETGGHIKRMSYYSELLAKLYGLSEEESKLVLYSAPLHDIGKVGIPDKILLKPGRFVEDEFEIMKMHAALGAKMLEGADEFPVLKAGQIIALQHHEKWDGSGYPNNLEKENIHLYARIVAIADVFDALSSKRCYKDAMPLDVVLDIMKKDAGKHFDPNLITLFLDNLDQFLEIKEKYKDDDNQFSITDLIKGNSKNIDIKH